MTEKETADNGCLHIEVRGRLSLTIHSFAHWRVNGEREVFYSDNKLIMKYTWTARVQAFLSKTIPIDACNILRVWVGNGD